MAKEIEMWVVMDKAKKAIACGSPRNRSMRLLESVDNNKVRILLYGTKKRAISAFSGGSGFYDETYGPKENPHPTYLIKTYGRIKHNLYEKICIPVKVKMVIEDEE